VKAARKRDEPQPALQARRYAKSPRVERPEVIERLLAVAAGVLPIDTVS
jgi:hypothetical protein